VIRNGIYTSWQKRIELDGSLSDRQIVEEEATASWIDPSKPTRKIIHDLMAFAEKTALDPAVSQDAVDLYLQGYNDGKEQAKSRY